MSETFLVEDNAQVNMHKLIDGFFEFSLGNSDKVRPVHGMLYCFILRLNNKHFWKENLGLQTFETMAYCCISSHNTYYKALNDLINWGFIRMVKKSSGKMYCNIVSIYSSSVGSSKIDVPSNEPSDVPSDVPIDTSLNILNVLTEPNKTKQETPIFENQVVESPSKPKPAKPRKPKTEFIPPTKEEFMLYCYQYAVEMKTYFIDKKASDFQFASSWTYFNGISWKGYSDWKAVARNQVAMKINMIRDRVKEKEQADKVIIAGIYK